MHNTAMGHFPPKCLEPPSFETAGGTEKVKVGPKMERTSSIHMPSLVVICRRTAARQGKMDVFCLFVTLTVCVSLGYRRAHCEGYNVANYRSILMQFSAFSRRRNALSNFSKISELHQNGATLVLELCKNSQIFQNLNDKVCAHDFDHLGEGWRKFHHSLLAQGL